MAAVRFHVAGRVQGVFFRASTRAEAERLGISGWAKNLADGGVEVFAQAGDVARIDELAKWLQDGPPRAQVTALERHAADEQGITGFAVY